ncbi:hypothetical protein FVE67_01995 [Thermosulfurimonas marina]|uniref:Uncharacterized protein n=1 Tax=Thermosulfurimonas marina TaxID=2047767 RepID=A0A6H1WR60_9BACT|nr:hypothetical protein [Thermosulfurimonas marina]QJA05644.1 hypothetical protein FVE67_01995 [Thermosulfurimonas marina]
MKSLFNIFRKNWCWLCAALVVGTGYLLVSTVSSRVEIESTPSGDLTLEEVQLLKQYHGAYAVKREGRRWYFLGPRKRHWYPLTTASACQDLKLPCPQRTSSTR